MKQEDLIIDEPRLVRPHEKLTAAGLTLLFWGALLYLWQPLISMVAWAFNIKLFYNHMIILGGYHTFLKLLTFYAVTVAILGGSLLLWARVNFWRFANANKRKGATLCTTEDIARKFAVDAESLREWQQMHNLAVTVTNEGTVAKVTATEVTAHKITNQ